MKKTLTNKLFFFLLIIISFFQFIESQLYARSWSCQILPSEQKIEIDSVSGAKIIFVTTNKASDTNLYFHDRCWLLNNQFMLFRSDRTGRSELFGYLAKTGELVRLNQQKDAPAGAAVASRNGDTMFVVRENAIYQWKIEVTFSPKTAVHITENKICDFPEGTQPISGLNENATGELVSFGYKLADRYYIAVTEVATGKSRVVARPLLPIQHIQFSWTRPDLLSFAVSYGSDTAPLDANEPPHSRIWFVNINTGVPLPAFYQKPGELVTHECWWVNDQITFIGGFRKEEGHVKVLDLKTGEIRIIGAGAWLPDVTSSKLASVNWWHASGSPDGRWVAADNWHGNIAIFNAGTTEMNILTTGHRTYGHGAHPHVGWDLKGKSVEFTSNKLGNPDVCIGFIPESWH